jgi:Spy/CpxP family protein refolding chaperone
MKKQILRSCSLVLLSGLAFAQTQHSMPTPPTPAQIAARELSHLTDALSLTSAQQSEAATILTAEAGAQAAQRTGMDTARKALETAIEANDSAGIGAAAVQIGELTTQQVQSHATAQAALYAILTPEQQTKLKSLFSRGPGGFGHGPGGPGMPPPPGP